MSVWRKALASTVSRRYEPGAFDYTSSDGERTLALFPYARNVSDPYQVIENWAGDAIIRIGHHLFKIETTNANARLSAQANPVPSTAIKHYDGETLLSGKDTNGGFFAQPAGNYLYLTHPSSGSISRIAWSTGYDIESTPTLTSWSTDVATPFALTFNSAGTLMWVYYQGATDAIREYTLSTAWDVTTASYNSASVAISSTREYRQLFLNSDGTKLFTFPSVGGEDDAVTALAMSTGYDLSTYTGSTSHSLSVAGLDFDTVWLNDDGTKAYGYLAGDTLITDIPLSTAYDLSTSTWSGTLADTNSISLPSMPSVGAASFTFSSDGTKFYLLNNAETLYEWPLSSIYDLSTAGTRASLSLTDVGAVSDRGVFLFNDDGTKFFVADTAGTDAIHEYALSTAWDITSATRTDEALVSGTAFWGMFWNNTGDKMLMGISGDINATTIQEIDLTTAYDISTQSVGQSTDVGTGNTPATFSAIIPDHLNVGLWVGHARYVTGASTGIGYMHKWSFVQLESDYNLPASPTITDDYYCPVMSYSNGSRGQIIYVSVPDSVFVIAPSDTIRKLTRR